MTTGRHRANMPIQMSMWLYYNSTNCIEIHDCIEHLFHINPKVHLVSYLYSKFGVNKPKQTKVIERKLNFYFSPLEKKIHLCIEHMSGRHWPDIGKRLPIFLLPAGICPMWASLLGQLNWRKGSPQETRPEWENSSLGFIEAVHQW